MIQFDKLSISYCAVPDSLANASCRGVLWQASPAGFLLHVPDVARYLVESGTSVTIDSVTDADPALVEYHLGLLPLAALVYQQGMLAFHAAAVCSEHGALLLAGNSGSGKSTLLTALLQSGWKMFADEVAIVGIDENQTPMVYPTRPGVALWPESIHKLHLATTTATRCDANRREYVLPGHYEANPRPLLGIFRLNVHNKADVECEELSGSARFKAMGPVLYNSHVAEAICSKVNYFRCVTAIAQTVTFGNLMRPRGVWSVGALCNKIQQYAAKPI